MQDLLEMPHGEKAEQVVSYLILANMAAEFDELPMAKTYLAKATPLIESLMHKQTYRSSAISRFAELTAIENGKEGSIFLPFVGKRFVLPMLKIEEIKQKKEFLSHAVVELKDFHITYFKLIFNVQECLQTIKSACALTSFRDFVALLAPLFEQIFQEPIAAKNQFDIAQDNFMLARIILVHNPIFASYALQHADDALIIIGKDKDCSNSARQTIVDMRQQIQLLQAQIKNIMGKGLGTAN